MIVLCKMKNDNEQMQNNESSHTYLTHNIGCIWITCKINLTNMTYLNDLL